MRIRENEIREKGEEALRRETKDKTGDGKGNLAVGQADKPLREFSRSLSVSLALLSSIDVDSKLSRRKAFAVFVEKARGKEGKSYARVFLFAPSSLPRTPSKLIARVAPFDSRDANRPGGFTIPRICRYVGFANPRDFITPRRGLVRDVPGGGFREKGGGVAGLLGCIRERWLSICDGNKACRIATTRYYATRRAGKHFPGASPRCNRRSRNCIFSTACARARAQAIPCCDRQ